ncbi:MAG: hypothetical protein CSB16_00010 [Clostridiales bacterium]|nr:MAG: hypothetical protein CSB16_00010 [Clostridiales bacterium]
MNTNVEGLFVYRDKKNRVIYKDIFSKDGYIIKPNKISTFKKYQNRYLAAIAVVALGYNFVFTIEVWTIIAGIILIALEYLFRNRFLTSCEKIENFDTSKAKNIDKLSRGRIIILAVLYLILSVLLIANAIIEKLPTLAMILSFIAAAIAFARFTWSVNKLVKDGK